MLKNFVVEYLEKKLVAEGNYIISLTKPQGYGFLPGQYFKLSFDKEDFINRGNSHSFSIYSAPNEETISILTTMTNSDFKTNLLNFNPGDKLFISPPMGEGISAGIKQVFLVGGVGISPVRSYIRSLQSNKDFTPQVFWSNKNKNYLPIAILLELEGVGVKVLTNFTDAYGDCIPEREFGRISAMVLTQQLVGDLKSYRYYAYGGPDFVVSMREMLYFLDIPNEHVMINSFSGY